MIKYPLNVTIDSNIFDSNQYDFEAGSTMNLLTNYVKNQNIFKQHRSWRNTKSY